ncbi:hypothetical protein INT45_009065 [Circinella minor]|uniref:Uncharacterized protein n=1 Tax=Circinella minor TaxID=1195481 RepID=A0A8H7VL91_9FUNG|nr:hypothetical protein INT45_009065 [Circinella minor]
MSDYSGSDDDYEPIAVTSWGDQTKKELELTVTKQKEENDVKNDWNALLDPNAKVSETGLGSGGLHRQGKNYQPVDETLILQQRLLRTGFKTKEEKRQHKDKNTRTRPKIDRYAKESSYKKSNSTRFSSSSSKSPFSTRRASLTSFSSTASSTSFPRSSSVSTTSQSSSSSSSSTITAEKSNNVPLACYRQTAPWDTEYPSNYEISSQSAASAVSSSSQQQSKKKGPVRFSHPIEQPPPMTLHSPKMKKTILPFSSTTDTILDSLSSLSSPTSTTSNSTTTTKNPSHLSPCITKASVDRTRSTPPVGNSTNPWLNTPLMDEPFWANGTKTDITEKEDKENIKTNKEGDNDKLVEDVEPQQLQKLDIMAASKWTSGHMLTPSPVTTPTKKKQPPIWEPPDSADWFKTFESLTSNKDDKDNVDKSNDNKVTNNKIRLYNTTSVATIDNNNQQGDVPPLKHQQLTKQVIGKRESPPTPPTSIKDTRHEQSCDTLSPAGTPPRLVSSPANSTELLLNDSGLQTPPGSVQASVTSKQLESKKGGDNMRASSSPKSLKDITSGTWNSSSTSTWNDTSSKDNTWKDASKSSTNSFSNKSSTSSWNEQPNWNDNNDSTNTWGSSTNNNNWDTSSYNQQQQQQTISDGRSSSEKTSRFSRPDRPKYSTRQRNPRPVNYRPGQPITPPTKVAPPSRLDNPVIISINVELGPNKKIPVHIHQFDNPQTLAQHFANEHSIQSPNIVAALYQLFSTQKSQAMKRRGRPM